MDDGAAPTTDNRFLILRNLEPPFKLSVVAVLPPLQGGPFPKLYLP